MIDIADYLKEKIHAKGISINALEKQAGLRRGAIQNIIYGRSRNPGIEILRTIAQVLECSVSELIGEDVPSIPHSEKRASPHIPWNPQLYHECFNVVEDLLKRKKYSM